MAFYANFDIQWAHNFYDDVVLGLYEADVDQAHPLALRCDAYLLLLEGLLALWRFQPGEPPLLTRERQE